MWLKILCSGRKNNSAPVPIQNGVRCLTTKLTLSFALINTNIATAKKCCWHFFVARKKERQWDLMNDTNARNSFFVCTSIATKWGRCTGKMYDADLIARTCTAHTYVCFCCDRISLQIHVYFVVLLVMFIIPWNAFNSIVGFHPNKKLRSILFCLLNENDKIKMHRDMMEWLESRR